MTIIDNQRHELMAEFARLYYKEKLNQSAVAKKMNTSISTISRLLQEAHDQKIVEIIIRYPTATVPTLEKKLEEKLPLKAAHVLRSFQDPYPEVVDRVAQQAALVLDDYLEEGKTLGISLGMAVAATARHFRSTKPIHCKVIRLQGASENELLEGTNLTQTFANQLGGEFTIIPSPWLLKSEELALSILQETSVAEAVHMAEQADIALVGMGTMDPDRSTIFRNQLISCEELGSLRDFGIAGEICGKHYDRNGNVQDVPFNRRTVAINIEKLRDFSTVIGVAAGKPKAEAAMAAARGGLISVLVTDSDSAEAILEKLDST